MKLNKYIWMAVLPMVFTACQQEVLIEELPMDSALSTITCTIGDEQADSRAQIVLGNKNREQEIFHWNAGDEFTLFQAWEEYIEGDGLVGKYISYTYTIDNSYSNDAPKGYADFTSDRALEQIDKDWIAFYPVTSVDEEITKMGNFCQLRIDNKMTDNSEESWRNYFKNNMYMMTYGDADALSSGVSFEHLCGIVRITYTNATSTDHELKGIYVDGTLGNMQEYEIGGPNHEVQDRGSSNSHGITFTDKATVAAGASEDFYILYFRPTAGPDGEIQDMKGIKVDYGVDGTSSMSQTPEQYFDQDFSYNGFQPGLCSWFKITGLDNNKIVWTRDYNPKDDEEEQPGGGELISGTETTVSDYGSLITALDNDKISKIKFSGDVILTAPLVINRNVQFDLQNNKLKLSSDFETLTDVIEVRTAGVSFYLDNAVVDLTDHTSKMNSFIKTSGVGVKLYMGGTTIKLGNNFGPAILMGDDQLTVGGSSITASTAISYRCTQDSSKVYESEIDANINGIVSFSSATGTLNTHFNFIKGNIDGPLNIEDGVNDDVYIADYIKFMKGVVTFGNNGTGWDKAGYIQ